MKQKYVKKIVLAAIVGITLGSCQSETEKELVESTPTEITNSQPDSLEVELSELEESEKILVQESEPFSDKILEGVWLNDNPWQGKGSERYKDFEELDFRSDRTLYQDGRLIGIGWMVTKDRDGDLVIEYSHPRKRRPTQLVILSSSGTTFRYGFKSGNGEYSLTKKQ